MSEFSRHDAEVNPFREYIAAGVMARTNRLADVQTNIAILHFEIARLEADKVRAKKTALESSQATSASARDQQAFVSTAEADAVIIELRAKQAALIEEKFFLLRLSDLLDRPVRE